MVVSEDDVNLLKSVASSCSRDASRSFPFDWQDYSYPTTTTQHATQVVSTYCPKGERHHRLSQALLLPHFSQSALPRIHLWTGVALNRKTYTVTPRNTYAKTVERYQLPLPPNHHHHSRPSSSPLPSRRRAKKNENGGASQSTSVYAPSPPTGNPSLQ